MTLAGRMHQVWYLVPTLMFLLLAGRGALACSCNSVAALDLIERTPVIFSGTAETEEISADGVRITTTFAVTGRIKGSIPSRAIVHTNQHSAICGYSFARGEPLTVFAYPTEANAQGLTGFVTSLCTMGAYSGQRQQVDAHLAAFRAEDERLRRALEREPRALPLLLEWAGHLERMRDSRAAAAYRDLTATSPDLPSAHLGLARLALRARAPTEATDHALRALALSPADPEALRLLAFTRLLSGDMAILETLRDLRGLEMEALHLPNRDLRNIDFTGARIRVLQARGADLRGARFDEARIDTVDLTRADLRGAQMTRLTASVFRLAGAVLDGSDLSGISLAGALLTRAALRGVRGDGANFRGADLLGAQFRAARLLGAHFERAMLIDADLSDAELRGADFGRANLSGANLSRADIRGTNFRNAAYSCGTRLPAGFTPEALGMVTADLSEGPCQPSLRPRQPPPAD